MLEDLKEETIVNKVGCFKLSTLMNAWSNSTKVAVRWLSITRLPYKMQIVLQEILQDKIFLDTTNEVRVTGQVASEGPDFDLSDL